MDIMDVQSNWNKLEEILVEVSDIVAPTAEFSNNVTLKSQIVPLVEDKNCIMMSTHIPERKCLAHTERSSMICNV